MTAEFERDLAAARQALDAARRELLATINTLTTADLERARRGGWTVRRVLQHVIDSERLYALLLRHLRGVPPAPPEATANAPESPADALPELDASRRALVAALEGVEEQSFYTLRTVGHEEYSIFSLLENVASHDREHAGQIKAIANGSETP